MKLMEEAKDKMLELELEGITKEAVEDVDMLLKRLLKSWSQQLSHLCSYCNCEHLYKSEYNLKGIYHC